MTLIEYLNDCKQSQGYWAKRANNTWASVIMFLYRPLKIMSVSRKPSLILPELETVSNCRTEFKPSRRGIMEFLDDKLRSKNKMLVKWLLDLNTSLIYFIYLLCTFPMEFYFNDGILFNLLIISSKIQTTM